MIGETVTLINRTKKTVLHCTFDGQVFTINPGENHGFPKEAVSFAKRQNPVLGTEHPYNPLKFESLVGVKGSKDPVTPMEQSKTAVERIDRSQMRGIGRRAKPEEGDPVTAIEARVGYEGDIDNEAAVAQR